MKSKLKKFFKENKELLEKSFYFPKVEFNGEKISLIYSYDEIYKKGTKKGETIHQKWNKYGIWADEVEEEIKKSIGIYPTRCTKWLTIWHITLSDIEDLK